MIFTTSVAGQQARRAISQLDNKNWAARIVDSIALDAHTVNVQR